MTLQKPCGLFGNRCGISYKDINFPYQSHKSFPPVSRWSTKGRHNNLIESGDSASLCSAKLRCPGLLRMLACSHPQIARCVRSSGELARFNPFDSKRTISYFLVLSVGIEPTLQDPQSCVLSIERREDRLSLLNFQLSGQAFH